MPATSATSAPKHTKRRSTAAILFVVIMALVASACMPADAKTFLDRTNSYRANYGLRAYKEHDTLTNKAEKWAQYMASTGKLAHSNLADGLGSLNWRSLGENVGYSSPTSDTLLTIHKMFVASSPHRANLVSTKFTHMGVGVAKDKYGRVWVAEVFAQL